MFGKYNGSELANAPSRVINPFSSCKILVFTKFAGAKSKYDTPAGKSIFMSVPNLEDIVNVAPASNKAYEPGSKFLTIDVTILYPPTQVPSSVSVGVPPNRPVPVSSP